MIISRDTEQANLQFTTFLELLDKKVAYRTAWVIAAIKAKEPTLKNVGSK